MPDNHINFGKGLLDTLVQNRTALKTQKTNTLILQGTGTDLSTGNTINLVKKKQISQIVALNLISVAEKKGKSIKEIKPYWNTYHCLCEVITSENRLYGNYCKTRICPICIAIHKAELINKYLPIIKNWTDAHFVTLTVPAIPANRLNVYMQDLMIRGIKKIIEKYRKPYERGKGKKITGVRSLECNFNPIRRTYNPHFHIIVPDRETGDILINEWLKLWHKTKPSRQAQHIRKVKDTEKDMIETIKYGTKIFTDPTVSKFKKKVSPYVYISAMDNILTAMKGKRLFEHFGFKLPIKTKIKNHTHANIYKNWKFDSERSDYVNFENNNETLFGLKISDELIRILKNNINLDLQ